MMITNTSNGGGESGKIAQIKTYKITDKRLDMRINGLKCVFINLS